MTTENKPKKKRGRPPKKKAELPKFESNKEIREYILNTVLKLQLETTEIAMKKNNIKKPSIANAKNQQYKTASIFIKLANDILKDLEINQLEEKIQQLEEYLTGNITSIESEDISEETKDKIKKLSELTEELAELKE